MNPKPFSQPIDNNLYKKTDNKKKIKPFVDDAIGGVENDNQALTFEKEQLSFFKKTINFLGSLQGVFTVTILFILILIIIDTIKVFQTLLSSGLTIDLIYLIAKGLLGTTFTIFIYKNYKEIQTLKNVKKTQKFFALQKIEANELIIEEGSKLLNNYAFIYNDEMKLDLELLKTKIKETDNYEEIYNDLDKILIKNIDKTVKEKIKTASIQAALSTAISPVALLDSIIIIWRSFLLTKDIAKLYGFKPSFLSTLFLLKEGVINTFFAGVAQLASEFADEAVGSSLASKISISVGQGLANGVLLARLGYSVMRVCRPLPLENKRDNFIKEIFNKIVGLMR